MEELKLKANKRDVMGKRNRFLRRQGITPTHLIGHNIESLALQCDTLELNKILAHAGATRLISLQVEGEKQAKSVFVREVQRDVLGHQLIHVDFYQVKKGEKMAVEVPIVLIGEAPALKAKGRMLAHGITSINVECLPEKVPPQIDIDISILEEVDQAIYVKDIILDPEITLHAEPEQLVCKISEAQMKVEEEVTAEEGEEGAEGEAAAEAPEGAAPEQPAAEAEGKQEG
jgi:large subunit ribosomal protein L25